MSNAPQTRRTGLVGVMGLAVFAEELEEEIAQNSAPLRILSNYAKNKKTLQNVLFVKIFPDYLSLLTLITQKL